MDNQLHEVSEEAGRSRKEVESQVLTGGRILRRASSRRWKDVLAGNLGVGGERPREFQADGYFLFPENEAGELGSVV